MDDRSLNLISCSTQILDSEFTYNVVDKEIRQIGGTLRFERSAALAGSESLPNWHGIFSIEPKELALVASTVALLPNNANENARGVSVQWAGGSPSAGIVRLHNATIYRGAALAACNPAGGYGVEIVAYDTDLAHRVEVANSVIAGEPGPAACNDLAFDRANAPNVSFVSRGYNRIGDIGVGIELISAGSGDVFGADSAGLEQGPSVDAGSTESPRGFIPFQGGPLVNAGSPLDPVLDPTGTARCALYDQASRMRPAAAVDRCDIGAKELSNSTPIDPPPPDPPAEDPLFSDSFE